MASYPFDDSRKHQTYGFYSAAPDDAVFKRLATIYASQHDTMKTGHVCPGDNFPGGITNGAHWYEFIIGAYGYSFLLCLENEI